MEPRISTSTKSSYSSDPRLNSPTPAPTPRTCALCGKTIKGGQRFLTLSVDEGNEPRRSDLNTTEKKSIGPGRFTRDAVRSRKILGRFRLPTSVTCHLQCLFCVECGFPLSGPPRGAPNDNRGLLFDRGGAAAAYKKSRGSLDGKAARGNAASVGMASTEGGRERWVADILKKFVAHAKCAERVCSVCGEVISPGEQQITLPHNSRQGRARSNDVGGPFSQMNSRSNSAHSEAMQAMLSTSKTDKKKFIYQHMRCTCCATCGLPLSERKSCEALNASGPKDRHGGILLDDSGRPHHASCIACCCCRRPLFGGYEVHSFFGYLKMCQQALGEDPPLLPFPEGRAAALFGSVKNQYRTQLQKSTRATESTQSRARNQLQELVTPKFGGLCCAWCQGRVPCCVSCERRCTVYTDANGHRFSPRALTSKAQRAAKLATAISLGEVVPPADVTGSARMSATTSNSVRPRSKSDALYKLLSSSRGGKQSVTGNGATEGGTVRTHSPKSQSDHTLKTAETQGVLCGQCSSLSLVETESHLRSCAEWVLQFFGEEGVVFTPEMIHLQHLMEKVSRDNAEGRSKRPFRRMSSTVTQTGSPSSAGSSVEGGGRQSVRRMENERIRSVAPGKLRSKGLTAKEPSSLQQVEAAGLRVDLVSFDALNNGQTQRNNAFLSTSSLWSECLPAVRPTCQIESMSSPFHGKRLALQRPRDSATMLAARLGFFPIKEQVDEPMSPNATVPTCSRAQASSSRDESKHYIQLPSRLAADSKSSHCTASHRSLTFKKGTTNFHNHVLDSAVGRWKGSEHPRLLFGRCHVVEVSLVVAPDAAHQFDKQLRAAERRYRQTRTVDAGSGDMKSMAEGATGTSKARGNMALKRMETPVNQKTFERAAACAASVENEDDQPNRLRSADKREDGDTEVDAAVTAGALLMKGSFMGGLVKTASGLHAQGLRVRLVKRLAVVGVLPRVMVLQHLAHEFVHAFFACKQKVIKDLPAEEGACNVAAAAVLLRTGVSLKELLRDSYASSKSNNMSSCSGEAPRNQYPSSCDVSFELLLVRYRLWKMAESNDEVYGVGYRRCLESVRAGQLTFGAFVSRLLKTPQK